MSRLYDTIEPSVIDEQMLKKCVEEQGPKGEAGRIAKQEGLDFADVLSLRLDFKSKIHINCLFPFSLMNNDYIFPLNRQLIKVFNFGTYCRYFEN